jgi:hypothetical protein
MRKEFYRSLEDIPDDRLDQSSDNPDWNVREVILHMTLAPRPL